MRVVEQLSLEHRRVLHLVEVDGHAFLIGSSEHAIQLIAALNDDRVDADAIKEKPEKR